MTYAAGVGEQSTRLVSGEAQLLRVRLKLRIEHPSDWRLNVLISFPELFRCKYRKS